MLNRYSRLGQQVDFCTETDGDCSVVGAFDRCTFIFFLLLFFLLRRLEYLYLEVNLLAESRIQVDLELCHFLLDCVDLVFQLARLLVDSLRRRRQHLLRLLKADVEEGVADFVSAHGGEVVSMCFVKGSLGSVMYAFARVRTESFRLRRPARAR